MIPRFTFELEGVEGFDRSFSRLEKGLDDFRPLWPEVIKYFHGTFFPRLFSTEGAAGEAGKWAALSPAYAKYKAQKYPGQPILQATGALYASLTDIEAVGAVVKPERDELIIGSNIPYGKFHQKGQGVPKRPMSFSNESRRAVQKAIQKGLVRFTRELGFKVEDKAA